jgi:outer membrane immunogenic protein
LKDAIMKRLSALIAGALVLGAGYASAQGLEWTGAYGGVSMATNSGEHEYDNSGTVDYDLEGPAFGAFGGYLWGNGAVVYGAEAALTFGGVYEVDPETDTTYKDEYEYDQFIDVKGRVGYAAGDFLVYGALGMSWTRFQSNIGGKGSETINTSGMVYGIGADYRIADRYFAGAEVLRRTYDFYDAGQDVDIDAEMDTFTLRVGMRF